VRVVGSASEISIFAPDDAYFSYFNSPYIGHSLGTAIDIYPRHQEWGGPVLAPVSGEIVKVKKLHMGKTKPFPTDDFDYGIAIRVESTREDVVRVMHCKPMIQEGDKIDLGDQIGYAIRSRYFNYWTSPHYHVEIMQLESFSRSSKSYPLDIPVGKKRHQLENADVSMELSIIDVNDDRDIGYLRGISYTSIGDLIGLSTQDEKGSVVGILDGGLSHYQHGGVIGTHQIKAGDTVFFGGHPIGNIASRRGEVGFFERGPSIVASFNGIELRGLSCFLYPPQYTKRGIPQTILIPREHRGFRNLIENDSIGILEISSSNNMNKF
jgi:hypothetical protein